MNLNEHIANLLKKHTGGEEFFDAIDNSFREANDLIEDILDLAVNEHPTCFNVIVSGEFGRVFANYVQITPMWIEAFNVVTVKGGLRKGEPIDSLEWAEKGDFIFIDDSFYLGRTRDAIKAELERVGSSLSKTFVIYDGSKEEDSTVHSLYRYYDHH